MRAKRYTGTRYTSAAATSAWVGPEGEWYHVQDCGHYEAARIMGESIATLERAGWVHLSWGTPYMAVGSPTAAQLVRLEECAARWAETALARHRDGSDVFDVEEAEDRAEYLTQYVRTERNAASMPRNRSGVTGFYTVLEAALAPKTYRRDGD
jgi:hypothetical protein